MHHKSDKTRVLRIETIHISLKGEMHCGLVLQLVTDTWETRGLHTNDVMFVVVVVVFFFCLFFFVLQQPEVNVFNNLYMVLHV